MLKDSLSDLHENRGHYFSRASAMTFGTVKAVGLVLFFARTAPTLLKRHKGWQKRLLMDTIIGLEGRSLLQSVEHFVDSHFYHSLQTSQRLHNVSATTQLVGDKQHERESVVKDLEKRDVWPKGHSEEHDIDMFRQPTECTNSIDLNSTSTFDGTVAFFRPLAIDHRFLWDIAIFTRADPEPLVKWPLLDVSLFRLTSALGLNFVCVGGSGDRIGTPRASGSDQWRDEVRDLAARSTIIFVIPSPSEGTQWEVAMLSEQGYLPKTIFLMPPSIWPDAFDIEVTSRVGRVLLAGLFASMGILRSRKRNDNASRVVDRTFDWTNGRFQVSFVDTEIEPYWDQVVTDYRRLGFEFPQFDRCGAAFTCSSDGSSTLLSPLATVKKMLIQREPDENAKTAATAIKQASKLHGGDPKSFTVSLIHGGNQYSHLAAFFIHVAKLCNDPEPIHLRTED